MKASVLFLVALLVVSAAPALSQSPCSPPEIVFNKKSSNIFDETQEMYLGDVLAEYIQKNYRIIDDAEANRYVRMIGERLIRHLPPTTIKFQFYVVDQPTLNAFAAPGGRIYITRKMIAFVRNEDELAGIIGHELGHGIVRHSSTDISRVFKELLKVEQVTDKIFRDSLASTTWLAERRSTTLLSRVRSSTQRSIPTGRSSLCLSRARVSIYSTHSDSLPSRRERSNRFT